jgi:DNA-binding transcriptional regulator YdaS (Cro superfamily)
MVETFTPYEALQLALDSLGSQSELARICGVSPTAVWKWVQSSKRIPPEYVLRVEAASGVSRHWLRPDIYPVDMPPAPVRFHGADRRVGARNSGLDSRKAAVSFKRQQVSKGAAL